MPDTTLQSNDMETQEIMINEVRDSVSKLCSDFQGEYWRKLDREQGYPTDFVTTYRCRIFRSINP